MDSHGRTETPLALLETDYARYCVDPEHPVRLPGSNPQGVRVYSYDFERLPARERTVIVTEPAEGLSLDELEEAL